MATIPADHETFNAHHDDAHEHDHKPAFFARWFMSTNHKDIGTLYLIFAIIAGIIGGGVSGIMRAELAHPGIQYLGWWTHFVGGNDQDFNATLHMWNVLITGHPFVDVWEGVRPKVLGIDAWPQVPRGQPWKDGVCAALGVDPARFWPQLRNRVHSFADLRPELVGAVERLIDFVAPPGD